MSGSIYHTPVEIWGYLPPNVQWGTHGLGSNGGVVSRIGLFAGTQRLNAIRVWLTTDVSPVTFGLAQGNYQEFIFREGELITSMSAWGSSQGLTFTTSHGRTFRHQASPPASNGQGTIHFEVASGIWVGVIVLYLPSQGLFAFGLRFLRPILMAQMVNVRYPTLDLQSNTGIRVISVQEFRDENRSHTGGKQWTNSGSYTITRSSAWSVGVGIHVHASVRVSARVPLVGGVESEFGWALDVVGNFETSTEETETTEWSRSGTLPPRHRLTFQVTTRRGVITLPYEADMQIHLRDGPTFSYPIRGIYDGVTYTRLDITYDVESIDAFGGSASAAEAGASPAALVDHDSDVISTSKVIGSPVHKRLPALYASADDDHTSDVDINNHASAEGSTPVGEATLIVDENEHDPALRLVAAK